MLAAVICTSTDRAKQTSQVGPSSRT